MGVQIFDEKEPTDIPCSAVWQHDPNVRKLIFIAPATAAGTQVIELKIIPDDQRAKR